MEKEIKATIDSTPNVLRHMLQFFSCAHFVGSSCECHVCDDVIDCHCGLIHETFSYVRVLDNGIDNDMLSAFLKCLERGKCPHLAKVTELPDLNKAMGYSALVQLIDAATVAGNMPVLNRMLSFYRHNKYKYWPDNSRMNTIRLAIMHNQLASFKAILSTRLIDPLALPALILILVIYDKPKFLEIVLKSINNKRFKTWLIEMVDIATMLGSMECLSVFRQNGVKYVPREDNVRVLIKLMKKTTISFLDVLYFNPVFATCKIAQKSVLQSAIKMDLKGCYSTMYKSKYRGLISILLLDGGYNIRKDEAVLSSYETLLKDDESTLSEHENAVRERLLCRIKNELFSPKPLQLRCRDVLRRTYTGKKLHVYMSVSNIPTALKRFIMLQESHYNSMFILNSQ